MAPIPKYYILKNNIHTVPAIFLGKSSKWPEAIKKLKARSKKKIYDKSDIAVLNYHFDTVKELMHAKIVYQTYTIIPYKDWNKIKKNILELFEIKRNLDQSMNVCVATSGDNDIVYVLHGLLEVLEEFAWIYDDVYSYNGPIFKITKDVSFPVIDHKYISRKHINISKVFNTAANEIIDGWNLLYPNKVGNSKDYLNRVAFYVPEKYLNNDTFNSYINLLCLLFYTSDVYKKDTLVSVHLIDMFLSAVECNMNMYEYSVSHNVAKLDDDWLINVQPKEIFDSFEIVKTPKR